MCCVSTRKVMKGRVGRMAYEAERELYEKSIFGGIFDFTLFPSKVHI